MPSGYQVKTDVFEGPFDVLLSLIEKRKLLINDVSLAQVADDFIAYIAAHESFPMDEAAHFVLVASTLLLIKSKSLLPVLSLTEEEEASVEDLETRLELYKHCKKLSLHVKEMWGVEPLNFRDSPMPQEPVFSPHQSLTRENLSASMHAILERLPKPSITDEARVRKTVSIDEMIGRLREHIEKRLRLSFREFSASASSEKSEVVVSFLAVLELVKQGTIKVEQEGHFSDILIERDAIGVPNYG